MRLSTKYTGAYHSAERPLVFDTAPRATVDSQNGFAVVGGYGWSTYFPGRQRLIRLGWGEETGLNLGEAGEYEASCGAGLRGSGRV